jgi:hypothetical protein
VKCSSRVSILITQEQSCNRKTTTTKEQGENEKVEPAPPSSDNNKTIRVVFEVELLPKDQVVERMSERIEKGDFFPTSKGDITLKISVLACSEGSRCGRICCAELGVGWVMLDCEWLLMTGDATKLTKPTKPKTESLRSSGAIGFRDVCDANYGENTILNDLCYKWWNKLERSRPRLSVTSSQYLFSFFDLQNSSSFHKAKTCAAWESTKTRIR